MQLLTTFLQVCLWKPYSGRELFTAGKTTVFASHRLFMAVPAVAITEADKVRFGSRDFEISLIKDWDEAGRYYRLDLLKVKWMHIKLRKDWHSYWRGSVIEVEDEEAILLIQKKIASYSSSKNYMTKRDLDFALKRRWGHATSRTNHYGIGDFRDLLFDSNRN